MRGLLVAPAARSGPGGGDLVCLSFEFVPERLEGQRLAGSVGPQFEAAQGIIGTVLGILLIAGLSFLPTLLSLLTQQSTMKIAVVDQRTLKR